MPKKILVADDDKAMLGLYDRIFTSAGYSISKAGSFGEASKLLRDDTFDLLITDFMFQDGLGTDLAAAFRSTGAGGKCLLVTGSTARRGDLDKGGVDYWMEKPFKVEELLTAVGKVLS